LLLLEHVSYPTKKSKSADSDSSTLSVQAKRSRK